METKLGQSPAFPLGGSTVPSMSKRFYAACAAMQGILSNPTFYKYMVEFPYCEKDFAKGAVKYADALIKELNEQVK